MLACRRNSDEFNAALSTTTTSEEDNRSAEYEAKVKQMMRQLEYYFCNNNLDSDKFMQKALRSCGGYLEVGVLATFARVTMIARGEDKEKLIIKAASMSDFLGLHYEGGRVFLARVKPYTAREAGIRSQLKARGATNLTVPPRKGRIGEEHGAVCKYYCAGYCGRGRGCPLSHDMEYARAVEDQWLQPENQFGARMLRELVERLKLPRKMARPARPVVSDYKEKVSPQKFEYFAVLDLEGRDEIIEFPVLVFHVGSMREVGRFHRWVRPVELFKSRKLNPESQAIPFPQVLKEFESWMARDMKISLNNPESSIAFVTCGNWDIKSQVPKQCAIARIPVPQWISRWINIKDVFNNFYRSSRKVTGMRGMLRRLEMLGEDGSVEGVHHLGMDDVENISRVLLRMLEDGAIFNFTAHMTKKAKSSKEAFLISDIPGIRDDENRQEWDSEDEEEEEDDPRHEYFDPDRYIDRSTIPASNDELSDELDRLRGVTRRNAPPPRPRTRKERKAVKRKVKELSKKKLDDDIEVCSVPPERHFWLNGLT